jgi:hypothetical protein
MLPRPRTRTLKSSVLRVLVPRALVFAALSGALLLGHEMAAVLAPEPPHDAVLSAPIVPTWTAADAAVHPECTPTRDWPRGAVPPYLMVHDFRANADRKMAFGLVWRRTHNSTEVDDVWVVGACSR